MPSKEKALSDDKAFLLVKVERLALDIHRVEILIYLKSMHNERWQLCF